MKDAAQLLRLCTVRWPPHVVDADAGRTGAHGLTLTATGLCLQLFVDDPNDENGLFLSFYLDEEDMAMSPDHIFSVVEATMPQALAREANRNKRTG